MNSKGAIYGPDRFTFALVVVSVAISVIGLFFSYPLPLVQRILTVVSMGLIAYAMFRMFSRNATKRRGELVLYLRFEKRVIHFFKSILCRLKGMRDRSHRYFCCPRCNVVLRVPRGNGNIKIHCRACGNRFTRFSGKNRAVKVKVVK